MAVVVARDRYAADALEAVEVDYTPLPPVLDLEAALAEDAPRSLTRAPTAATSGRWRPVRTTGPCGSARTSS